MTKGTPFTTVSVMNFRARPFDIYLDARAVQKRVTYTLQHITRLERAGHFPKRIRLGDARVGWSLREVLVWMQSKVDARPSGPMSRRIMLDVDARFIRSKELRLIVLFAPDYVRELERAGKFPKRIWIGQNRVVWLESEIQDWVELKRKNAVGD